jgi:hypothetical protein
MLAKGEGFSSRRINEFSESGLMGEVLAIGKLSERGLNDLAKIRLLALRRGVFFRVLSRVERALIYLAPKVTRNVRSAVLANALNSIARKLLDAMESKFKRQMRQVGVPLAKKISKIAWKWGNKTACEWANDPGFIQYLTITYAGVT